MFPQLGGLGQNITYVTSVCLNDPRETTAKCILMMTNNFLNAFIDMNIKSEGFSLTKYNITLNHSVFF